CKCKSSVFLILAPLFHFSAIIILLLAIASRYIKINTTRCYFVFVFALVFIFILNGVDFIFSNAILLDSKYGYYVTSAFNRPTEIGSGIGVAIALFLPFMVFIKSTQLYEYNKNYNFMLLINLVYVISYTLSLKIYIFARFTDALSFVQILLIPVILKISSPKGIYYNLMMAVILLHILLFEANLNANTISAGNISNSGLGIMPYKSILNTKIVGIYD
ncbi:O118/O151 family O-antigen polymerase, partial [Escherichia coli]|nr:O118/O151 family O-antigen polymerase [Escherichia coli]